MPDERVIPREFKTFCRALGECFSPPLSNRGLFQRLEMDGDQNELNRQARTPARGQLPQPSSFLHDFLDKIDAELAKLESELYTAALRPAGPLASWLSIEGDVAKVARDQLRKQYTLDDYVSAGYLRIDLARFRQLEAAMQDASPRDGATWTKIISDLNKFWKSTRGKKGTCFLPFISRLIVESTKRFNSHPPDTPGVDRIAWDLFRLLKGIGRQCHHGRFQESRDDMEFRHNAILVRATQYHAGRSVREARRLYRMILDIPTRRETKNHPKEAFVLNGRVPDDTSQHAVHVLKNVLCFEVCLGMDNFGDERWWTLDVWLSELNRRAIVLNDQDGIVHCQRITAEWHLCHLGMKIPKNDRIKYAKSAQACVQRIRTLVPGRFDPWMEWEILKIQSIIALVLESKLSVARLHDQLYRIAVDGDLHSQASGTVVFRKLIEHIDLYVQFAIQLQRSQDVLKQLKLRAK